MPQTVYALTLGAIAVRQHDGLYSLNDLHRAAGGEERHKPAFFLRMEWAQDLQLEIGKGADSHLFLQAIRGRNGLSPAALRNRRD